MSATHAHLRRRPAWNRIALLGAAIHSVSWGTLIGATPDKAAASLGLDRPADAFGLMFASVMLVASGAGFAWAVRDTRRWSPLIAAGLLGQVAAVTAILHGAGLWAVTSVLVKSPALWWLPLGMILWSTARSEGERPAAKGDTPTSFETALRRAATADGTTLAELSQWQPRLVVFLRHAGCTFCRETLDDLQRQRARIEQHGLGIVLVHMSPEAEFGTFLERYTLADLPRISDPQRELYRALGLRRGTLWQLFGPRVVWRGISAAWRGHSVSWMVGDVSQLAGAFIVHRGNVIRAFRHRDAADRPDYANFTCQWSPPESQSSGAA